MPNVGNRIKELRKGTGLTQEEFAKRIYVARGYLSRVERGKSQPSELLIYAIQQAFGVRKEWLLTGKGTKTDLEVVDRAIELIGQLYKGEPDKFEQVDQKAQLLQSALRLRNSLPVEARPAPELKVVSRRELDKTERWGPYVAVPLVEGAVAAGSPRIIEGDKIEDFCLVYESWCKRPEDYVCVRVAGDSMEPALPDGSIVAVHLKSRSPKRLEKKLVAARHEGGVAVKELQRSGEHWLLVSYNKEYPPLVIQPDEEENPIIGKVAWWWARQE